MESEYLTCSLEDAIEFITTGVGLKGSIKVVIDGAKWEVSDTESIGERIDAAYLDNPG